MATRVPVVLFHLIRIVVLSALLVLSNSVFASVEERYARVEQSGDWRHVCYFAVKDDELQACELYHIASVTQSGSVKSVLDLRIKPNNKPTKKAKRSKKGMSGFLLEVRTPLNMSLTRGVALKIDKSRSEAFPYRNCTRLGCRAVIPLTQKRVNQLRRGNWARFLVVLMPTKAFEIKVPLKGITKAIGMLQKKTIPTGPKLKVQGHG